jgi:hypothetical protein
MEKIGMLTVLDEWSDKLHRYCKVQCDCGTIKTVRRSSMKPGQTVSCGCYAKSLRKTGQDPRSPMWSRAKYRAKQKGLDFNITKEDIVIPDTCPLLGTPMESPSLDRINPSKGYIKGNVWVISNRANTLKNDATLTELKTLVENLQRLK